MAQAPPLGGPGFAVVKRVEAAVKRHGMLTGGETVVVAASGGPDSTCLLDVLARLSGKLDLTLEVAHVDHGLAEDSDEVAARVAHGAAAAGFDVHVVKAPDVSGSNLQARARDFRYSFFEIVAAQVGAGRVATGHTLDDRVETTLARLVHGAPTEVLAGIPPVEGMRIRPLIDLRRIETRAYCIERALEFHDDPANEDLRFERVAVRRKLVAAIEEHWGEGAVRAVAASSERLREDGEALAALAERLYAEVAEEAEDRVSIPVETLTSIPRALRRRMLEAAVGRIRDRAGGIDAALDALDRPMTRPLRFSVASGVEIEIDPAEKLVVRKSSN